MVEAATADAPARAEQAGGTETLDNALRLATIPLAGAAGYAINKSLEAYNPYTDAAAQQMTTRIPSVTGEKVMINGVPVSQNALHEHAHYSTGAEIGFVAIPMMIATAAVAIAAQLRRRG